MIQQSEGYRMECELIKYMCVTVLGNELEGKDWGIEELSSGCICLASLQDHNICLQYNAIVEVGMSKPEQLLHCETDIHI